MTDARDIDYFGPLPAQTVQEALDALAETLREPGPPGDRGEDGRDGLDGIDGKDGLNGQDGKDGSDGQDGKDGVAGKPGRDGKPGPAGPAGKDGRDGLDGRAGKDGRDGLDGAPGPGLPVGGTKGQIPVKRSARDFDIAWRDPPKGGGFDGSYAVWNNNGGSAARATPGVGFNAEASISTDEFLGQVMFGREVVFAANFPGARLRAETAPSGDAVIEVRKRSGASSSVIGLISFLSGANEGTISGAGATFDAGDRMAFYVQGAPFGLDNVSGLLYGEI